VGNQEVAPGVAQGMASGAELAAADDGDTELVPGSMAGEYCIVRALGKGGMSRVYAAVHQVLQREVAVKVLTARLARDAEFVRRFVAEGRNVCTVRHPNIVDVFAFGELPDGRPYFVMELLHGHTLRLRLEQGPAFTWRSALAVIDSVCAALVHAHAAGIVHRDLKPDNVFLAATPVGEVVKLLDFGIAKALLDDRTVQTKPNAFRLGTPSYMAPEQCLSQPITPRTDIYTLGLLLYRLFVGQRPFAATRAADVVQAQVSQAPRPPRTVVTLPAALDALILACLAKSPAERPETAAEVRAALADIGRELGAAADQPVPQPLGIAPPPPDAAASDAGIAAMSAVSAQPWADTAAVPPTDAPVADAPVALATPVAVAPAVMAMNTAMDTPPASAPLPPAPPQAQAQPQALTQAQTQAVAQAVAHALALDRPEPGANPVASDTLRVTPRATSSGSTWTGTTAQLRRRLPPHVGVKARFKRAGAAASILLGVCVGVGALAAVCAVAFTRLHTPPQPPRPMDPPPGDPFDLATRGRPLTEPPEPPPGTPQVVLDLASSPSGAEVFLAGQGSGRSLGHTPLHVRVPKQESGHFVLRLAGFADAHVSLPLLAPASGASVMLSRDRPVLKASGE
jgi:serine/threonine-protein kinase